MEIGFERTKNNQLNCIFDFSEYNNYPLTLTNISKCEKAEIKDMFMQTIDILFEQAWEEYMCP